MKFKLFSVLLLIVCFVFLGVLSGAIPVLELDEDVTAGLFPWSAASEPPASSAKASPTPALPPARTVPPLPSALPSPTLPPAASPTPKAAAAPATPAPSAPLPTETPAPEPTAAPTPSPAPAAPPPADMEQEETAELWEPAAAVISTTITGDAPLQNETDYTVDGKALLEKEPALSLPAGGTQILIIHTHGTEAYTPDGEDRYEAVEDYRTLDPEHSIIRVGQALGQALEAYGLNVVVDTGIYDWPNYDDAYANCAAAIQSYLEAEPDIAVVIDLHRDALGSGDTIYKTVSDQAPEAAQIMFVVGSDTNLPHPGWRDNLAFAMSLQGLMERQYPHLMRPTMLSSYRYNQQLAPGSVLLEIGTAGNTLQEAIAAAELFARTVGPVLADRVDA